MEAALLYKCLEVSIKPLLTLNAATTSGMGENMTIGVGTESATKSRRFAFRVISILTGVTVVTLVVGACSGPMATPLDTSSPASPPTQPAAPRSSDKPSPSSPESGAAALSSRSTDPLIIESVKMEFWEDYSFATQSETPLSQQALASIDTMNNGGDLKPLPPGGIIANAIWMVLTVAGNSSAPITINNMTIIRTCQKPPSGGTLFYSPTEGAGPFTVPAIYFNMDQPISVGQYEPPAGGTKPPGGNFFAKEVITLRYQEPQTLAIFITTRQYCRFSLQLNIATINGPVTQTVTDNGRPFTITSDGEPSFGHISPASVPFSSYAIVYAGGSADTQHNGKFIRVNPTTYRGTGDPASFPIP